VEWRGAAVIGGEAVDTMQEIRDEWIRSRPHMVPGMVAFLGMAMGQFWV